MNYINEDKFKQLITQYKNNPNDEAVANELSEMFYKLVNGVINGTSLKYFSKYTSLSREDLLQQGVLKCFQELDKFDPQRGNAFSFFSVIVKYELILYINKNLFFSEFSEHQYTRWLENLVDNTEKLIFTILEEWYNLLINECKKIMPQYKYTKYMKTAKYIKNILDKKYYTKDELLFIKNKVLPIIQEIWRKK